MIKTKALCSCSACVGGGMDQRRSISGKMTGGQFLKVTIMMVGISAANWLIGEVVQSRRRPLLGPSPG